MSNVTRLVQVLCFLLLASNNNALAGRKLPLRANSSGVFNITIKGVIITPPPCTINNNQPIDVNFGDDLSIKKIDGVNYLKGIDYTVTCTNTSSNEMKLSIQGTATDFDDNAALQTNMNDLGIELQQDGKKLKPGDWINFTYPTFPVLEAVPVMRSGGTLTAGVFTAGATMVVDWQ